MNTNTLLIIIEAGGLLVTILVIVVRGAYRNGEHRKQYESLEARMDKVEQGLASNSARFENSLVAAASLKNDIEWIKQTVDRIELKLAQHVEAK